MKRIKNILFYSWWLNFWVVAMIVVIILNPKTSYRMIPFVCLGVIIYAVYAMFVTKPDPPESSDEDENLDSVNKKSETETETK